MSYWPSGAEASFEAWTQSYACLCKHCDKVGYEDDMVTSKHAKWSYFCDDECLSNWIEWMEIEE